MAQNLQKQITLEPIDFVLVVKVCLGPSEIWTYRHLADELGDLRAAQSDAGRDLPARALDDRLRELFGGQSRADRL